jgi:Ribonuclease G/E
VKGRVIALDRIGDRPAAALLVDGRLDDLFIDPPGDDPRQPGAIFRGVVDRPMKGMGGVFVALAGGTGFLRQASGLAPGERVIVQVAGPAEPGKAPPLTQRVLFRGRTCIVTPGAPGVNLSRRLRDEGARDALAAEAAAAMAGAPEGFGLIVRAAAAAGGLAEEAAHLLKVARAVMADRDGGPELLLAAPDAHEAAWRDWAEPAADAVEDRAGAFADLGVFEAIAALAGAAALPGGGALHLEATRALVAVDINTGPDSSPAAGLKANIAAARDLPRQLRLRGLGGQVVVDFAPMPKKDRGTLEQVLRAAFRAEGAETVLAGWTPLGLYEIQRRRDRLPLAYVLPGGLP